MTPSVFQIIKTGENVVPVVGIALPLDADPLSGGASCFLPIGDLKTALPVHINACFHVHKNRRNIWMPDASYGKDSIHEQYAQWNDALLRDALPLLWREALLKLPSDEAVLARLPDLDSVEVQWKPCAEKLYKLVTDAPGLPHPGTGIRVKPSSSAVLVLNTDAFAALRQTLPALYEEVYASTFSGWKSIVFIPDHIEKAMTQHSGLVAYLLSPFIKNLLHKVEGAKLARILIALADLADAWPAKDKAEWKELLSKVAWVPLVGAGGFVVPSKAFVPNESLQKADLDVVRRHTANLTLDGTRLAAVERTAKAWGVKADLNWSDAVKEAKNIASQKDHNRANRLLSH